MNKVYDIALLLLLFSPMIFFVVVVIGTLIEEIIRFEKEKL